MGKSREGSATIWSAEQGNSRTSTSSAGQFIRESLKRRRCFFEEQCLGGCNIPSRKRCSPDKKQYEGWKQHHVFDPSGWGWLRGALVSRITQSSLYILTHDTLSGSLCSACQEDGCLWSSAAVYVWRDELCTACVFLWLTTPGSQPQAGWDKGGECQTH